MSAMSSFDRFAASRVRPYLGGVESREREYGGGEGGGSDCERAAETRAKQAARPNQRSRPQRQRQPDMKHPLVIMGIGGRVAPRRQRPDEPRQSEACQRKAESAGDERQSRQRPARRRDSPRRPRERCPRRLQRRLQRRRIVLRQPRDRVRRGRHSGVMELPIQKVVRQRVLTGSITIGQLQTLYHGIDGGQVSEIAASAVSGVFVGEVERQQRGAEQNRDGGERDESAARERRERRQRRAYSTPPPPPRWNRRSRGRTPALRRRNSKARTAKSARKHASPKAAPRKS